jgi:hypothetical protein
MRCDDDVRVLNDGLHSERAASAVYELFTTHDLKKPLVYQFILSGSQDKAVYQATMKAIMKHIRTKCRSEYIGAYEVGEEKGGLHSHSFVIIESSKHFPSDLLDVSEGKFLARLRKRKKISLRIEPPKNQMHGGEMYARMNTPEKLENCINWATYILKLRSKGNVPGRETYFGSEFASNIAKREAQRQKHRDAVLKSSRLPAGVPAAEEKNLVETMKALVEPELIPKQEIIKQEVMNSAERYIASKYEKAVDQQLDVEAIRIYLRSHGIQRTQAQVIHDLDNKYEFYEYAKTHPAPPIVSMAEADALIDREENRRPRRLPLPSGRLTTGRGTVNIQGTI